MSIFHFLLLENLLVEFKSSNVSFSVLLNSGIKGSSLECQRGRTGTLLHTLFTNLKAKCDLYWFFDVKCGFSGYLNYQFINLKGGFGRCIFHSPPYPRLTFRVPTSHPSEIKSRSASKKCHQFRQRTHPPPYDKSNALCLSEEKKLLTRKSLYLTKKVLQLQWEWLAFLC